MVSLQYIQNNKATINKIAHQFHATNVRIFGSVARGDNNNNSDIDLLVSFLSGASLTDQFELSQQLGNFFNCHVDIVSDKALNKSFSKTVLKEAIAL